tara:strand:- start:145 stop:504 length:360 start_codon:yes stop_codon:yes gene_type:complete
MNNTNYTWRIFSIYLLVIVLMLLSGMAFGQVKVIQFNADWNKSNQIEWIKDLSDCEKNFIDVGKDGEAQKKYKIAVLPTIIIFKDDEEVIRFQADLSFKMLATREEVQESIDDLLMSDF